APAKDEMSGRRGRFSLSRYSGGGLGRGLRQAPNEPPPPPPPPGTGGGGQKRSTRARGTAGEFSPARSEIRAALLSPPPSPTPVQTCALLSAPRPPPLPCAPVSGAPRGIRGGGRKARRPYN